ncbi:MAG: hypothetical protein WHV26_03455 [Spirochaetota bacterium]|jgi:uncharacterized membrane protein
MVDYESLSFEEQIKIRVDALYLEQRELQNIADLFIKLLGG